MSFQNFENLISASNQEALDNKLAKACYELSEKKLLSVLNGYSEDYRYEYVPEELEFVVEELAVERYNRIGSEGYKSETIDGIRVEYNQDSLENYNQAIRSYLGLNSEDENGGVTRIKFI